MRRFIDEYFETEDEQWLNQNFESIKNKVIELHTNGSTVPEIVTYLQDWLYIFNDDNETKWETIVVNNIINGDPVTNRWTLIQFT